MRLATIALAALCVACAGGPPPANWQLNAQSASEAATDAYLSGDSAAEASSRAVSLST